MPRASRWRWPAAPSCLRRRSLAASPPCPIWRRPPRSKRPGRSGRRTNGGSLTATPSSTPWSATRWPTRRHGRGVGRLRLAGAARDITGAASRPQVSASASATSQRLSANHLTPPSATPEGWNDYGRVTVDLGWDLDLWGRQRAALAAATSEREAARADLAQARLLLASSIASGYAELARLFTTRDTAAQAVEVRRKTAQLMNERFANGLENRGAARLADANLAAAEGRLLELDEQIGMQRHALAALMGAGPDRGLAIRRPALVAGRAFGLPPQLDANLLGRRPDVVAARLQAEAGASRIDQKKAEFYPNLNLSAFIGVQSLGLDMLAKGGSVIGSAGPALSLPIFSGGRLRGELDAAHAAHEQAVALYNTTLTRALHELADNALAQKALGARLARSEEAVAAATEAHRIARNRYEGSLDSYLAVLNAEEVLLDSLDAVTNLRARSLMLDIALNRALGGGYLAANQ
ncbi:efflux transporter outer membrane subunit [Massilia cavernae]|uniref:efflux transporter outer membrane subunit n=1 Tax=Massilia cavernae TaxID=2320864 RepID=UPI001E30C199|nr:efflux transporter outer membrane subunit [Massilia cavernae]